MKQSRIVLGLFALIIAFTISSCKDDDEVTKSKTDLLTQQTWRAKSGTPSDNIAVVFSVGGELEYTYKKDGTYSSTNLFDSDPSTGKWAFSTDESKLILDKGTSDEETIEIIKLNDSNLELKYTYGSDIITILYAKK